MNLHAILSRPSLVAWFRSGKWRKGYDSATLNRSRGYVGDSRLRKFEVVEQEDIIQFRAAVSGSYASSYQVSLAVFEYEPGKWLLEDDCTCPVGMDCKHGAALCMVVAERLGGAGFQESRSEAGELGYVENWLVEMGGLLKPSAPSGAEVAKKPNDTFLIYCLSPSQYGGETPRLLLKTARFLKNGTLRANARGFPKADPAKPAKFMVAEDTIPCSLFNQLLKNYYSYSGLEMKGASAGFLLGQICQVVSDRFYWMDENDRFTPIALGERITPRPSWIKEKGGGVRPGFEPPLANLIALVPTEPAYALCRDGGGALVLSELDATGHSTEFLTHWRNGPLLAPAQVAKAAVHIQTQAIPLPTPAPVEIKTLPAVKPAIHLRLARKNPYLHAGLHLSGRPEPVIADLSFRYHGHELIPDPARESPAGATFIAAGKDTTFTIPRDLPAEREAIETLTGSWKLVPAVTLSREINPAHTGAFLPDTAAPLWDAAMAEFINRAIPRLKELGWSVTADKSASFEIHHVGEGDLETGLEELPDHGIDWFQFTASYLTPAGDRQPLLPLLSAFLRHLDFDTIDSSLASLTDGDESLVADPANPGAFLALPTRRLLTLAKTLHDLFGSHPTDAPLHRLQAASLANVLEMDGSQTLKDLAALGQNLKDVTTLPRPKPPAALRADLRHYQLDGFHWMQFLARHSLHGILADDMGLGKTLQALAHIQAEVSSRRCQKRPCLVIAPTSVTGNWINEAAKFTPKLKTLLLHGSDRGDKFDAIPKSHLVVTSYALLVRDFEELSQHDFHLLILDEAQYIKNPAAKMSQLVCQLKAAHRLSLSGTPLENHLGELWSQMRFLMPGLLGSSEAFRKHFRTPIEKHQDSAAQIALNSRVAPLILRRTKDQVATELPPKTEILHTIGLNSPQVDLYETVRAAMDDRIREAIADKGLAKSQIIVLDALLKLRQICCHPQLLKLTAAQKVKHSAKLDYLTDDLLPTLLDEGRKVLLFSTFTSMLAMIEKHLAKKKIPFAKITGSTKDRQGEVDRFQNGEVPVFLISLKAGGTGLNLTAADTVIHYDPWWNPAAENQATDRAYRIGQDKPVFVHKLISEGTIEERIVELQSQKAKLVEALLSEKTTRLQIDQETLGNLLAPLGT